MTEKRILVCDNCREDIKPPPSPEGAPLWVEYALVTNQSTPVEKVTSSPPPRKLHQHLCLDCFGLLKARQRT